MIGKIVVKVGSEFPKTPRFAVVNCGWIFGSVYRARRLSFVGWNWQVNCGDCVADNKGRTEICVAIQYNSGVQRTPLIPPLHRSKLVTPGDETDRENGEEEEAGTSDGRQHEDTAVSPEPVWRGARSGRLMRSLNATPTGGSWVTGQVARKSFRPKSYRPEPESCCPKYIVMSPTILSAPQFYRVYKLEEE